MRGGESLYLYRRSGGRGWQGRGVEERWPVHYMQNRVHHSAPEPSQVAKKGRGKEEEEGEEGDGGWR